MKLLKSILALMCFVTITLASPIDLMGSKNGYDIHLKSVKSLVVGSNDFIITLKKDGKIIKDAKVKIKFFMPEMPGMPYMEYKAKGKLFDDTYKTNINFSMSGTWQYQLKFKTSDNKIHKIRGSVSL